MNNQQITETDSIELDSNSYYFYNIIPDSDTLNSHDSSILNNNQPQIINFTDAITNNNLSLDSFKHSDIQINNGSTHSSVIAESELIIKDRTVSSNDWIVGVLLILVLANGWLRVKFGKLYSEIITATLSSRKSNTLYLSQSTLLNKLTFTLCIIFYFTLGLFVTEIIQHSNTHIYKLNFFYVFIVVSVTIGIVISFKTIGYKLAGYLFSVKDDINEYLYNEVILHITLSVILLPFVIIIPFASHQIGDIIIYLGLFSISLFYLVQLLRGIQIVFKNKRGIIYPFLYFLGLELAPILILIKFARSNF